jgi:hypothetical protein
MESKPPFISLRVLLTRRWRTKAKEEPVRVRFVEPEPLTTEEQRERARELERKGIPYSFGEGP